MSKRKGTRNEHRSIALLESSGYPAPAAVECRQDGSGRAVIAVGSRVFLRGCAFGQPGTVLRIERSRAVVLWGDLDFLARHPVSSLKEPPEPEHAEAQGTGQ